MASPTPHSDLPLVPTPFDNFPTDTSNSQAETEDLISSILVGFGKKAPAGSPSFSDDRVIEIDDSSAEGTAEGWEDVKTEKQLIEDVKLERDLHAQFLVGQTGSLVAGFVALDASRPWLIFWAVNGLDILGVSLDPDSRRRAINTLLSFQNRNGGFGGGPGQMGHLAPTYAAISALVVLTAGLGGVVGEGDDGMAHGGEAAKVWAQVDRQSMYAWLLKLKQPDGSFVMHEGGEVDVRGCYCCLTVATLLNMLTPELARGTDRFIASCQTYEGGLASASHPFPGSSFLPSASGQPRAGEANPQLGEAHGGYTSCAVLAHFLLRPLATPNDESTLDLEACLRWTAQMQALPIEGGGFRGRTNKLVDGCYSWWCGGLFPILEALLDDVGDDKEDEDAMFARIALQEYTLLAAQAPYGGLRDKPGKQQDCYHSHYNLAGLSTAQNRIIWRPAQVRAAEAGWKQGTVAKGIKSPGEDNEVAEERMKRVYAWALGWEHVKEGKIIVGDKSNQVEQVHPCFIIRPAKVKKTLDFFYGQL